MEMSKQSKVWTIFVRLVQIKFRFVFYVCFQWIDIDLSNIWRMKTKQNPHMIQWTEPIDLNKTTAKKKQTDRKERMPNPKNELKDLEREQICARIYIVRIHLKLELFFLRIKQTIHYAMMIDDAIGWNLI